MELCRRQPRLTAPALTAHCYPLTAPRYPLTAPCLLPSHRRATVAVMRAASLPTFLVALPAVPTPPHATQAPRRSVHSHVHASVHAANASSHANQTRTQTPKLSRRSSSAGDESLKAAGRSATMRQGASSRLVEQRDTRRDPPLRGARTHAGGVQRDAVNASLSLSSTPWTAVQVEALLSDTWKVHDTRVWSEKHWTRRD